MAATIWQNVRREFGRDPIVAGQVGGASPVFVERYMFQLRETSVPGQSGTGMVTQIGASPVTEDSREQARGRFLPSHSMLVPPGTATHWVYSGVADFVILYFLDGGGHLMQSLITLAGSLAAPAAFSDPLVGAAVLQLANEVQRGPAANPTYQENLVGVILEQSLRALTSPSSATVDPRHAHYTRVQKVLDHLRSHLTDDLSATALATLAGLSLTHFRSVFLEAVGTPLHSYILSARLDQARALLTQSAMPLARVAQECGFSSQSHLTACFRKVYAVAPAQFRTRLSADRTG